MRTAFFARATAFVLLLMVPSVAFPIEFSDGTTFEKDTAFLKCMIDDQDDPLYFGLKLDRGFLFPPYLFGLFPNTSGWQEIDIDEVSENSVSFLYQKGWGKVSINRTTLSITRRFGLDENYGSCFLTSAELIEVAMKSRGGRKI